MMFLLESAKSSLDPSQFLRALKNHYLKEQTIGFDVFAQQDVVEILEVVLGELFSSSIIANEACNIRTLTQYTCHTCLQVNTLEDNSPILRLPLDKDVQKAVNSILQTETLTSSNAPFCHVCSEKNDSDSKLTFTNLGSCLIIQLKRFRSIDGVSCKDCTLIQCLPLIKIIINSDKVVHLSRKFSLFAVINHSGNLNTGHYTCFIKDKGSWWYCNDKTVTKTTLNTLDGSLPYVLCYKAV